MTLYRYNNSIIIQILNKRDQSCLLSDDDGGLKFLNKITNNPEIQSCRASENSNCFHLF